MNTNTKETNMEYPLLQAWHSGGEFWLGSAECEALREEAKALAQVLGVDENEIYERQELMPPIKD